MDVTAQNARLPVPPLLAALSGLALLVSGFYATIVARELFVAAIAGAGGLALLRAAFSERPFSSALIGFDAAAFAIFAYLRHDSLSFWQEPGPWLDVPRFNTGGSTIALTIYAGGSVMALIGGFRGLRLIEAFSLIALPFLFNLLLVVGPDSHLAEIGALVTTRPAP